jgi:hypothetical protein
MARNDVMSPEMARAKVPAAASATVAAVQAKPSKEMSADEMRDYIAELEREREGLHKELHIAKTTVPEVELPPNLPPAALQHHMYVMNLVKSFLTRKRDPNAPAPVARAYEVADDRPIHGSPYTGRQVVYDGFSVVFHTGKVVWDTAYDIEKLKRLGVKLTPLDLDPPS